VTRDRKGRLSVVGTGIEALGQLTPAARLEIERAEVLFYLVSDPLTAEFLHQSNPDSRSLQGLYSRGKHRLKTYAAMVEAVLAEVRRGKRVCFALYGHPGVFALPSHVAVRLARQEGYRATMLPAVSADACLFADLGIDPGGGCQSYEATDFLLRHRRVDTTVALVLWQVGVVGRFDFVTTRAGRRKLKVLTDELCEHYPARHIAVLYEASVLPGFEPAIERVEISKLHDAEVTPTATLYVPPAREEEVDPVMMARLGIKPSDRVHCLR
jgi:uncharacterized protein YabN with tetrapyrrole methylase and pyrophosphatase domain